MSVFTGQLDVDDSEAVQIFDEDPAHVAHEITIVNRSDSASEVFILDADDDVTSPETTGFGLAPGAGLSQAFNRPTDLRAMCATGGSARLQFITERDA